MRKHGFLLIAISLILATPALAMDSVGHSAQGSKHGSQALGHSATGASKLTSGVVAVPLSVAGEVGKAAGSVGEEMWDAANEPLTISDEAVTAGPPPSMPSNKKIKPGSPPSMKEKRR